MFASIRRYKLHDGAIDALARRVDESFAEEIAWWVEPDQRRTDIGRALLAEAEAWAVGAGICVLKMIAPTGSGIGRYYESLGYQPVEMAYMKRL